MSSVQEKKYVKNQSPFAKGDEARSKALRKVTSLRS